MRKNTANMITVLRGVLVPLFLLSAYSGYRYLALFIFILASISDFLDGYIARNYDQITVFGKFMDPLADKMLVISAMCFFCDADRFPGWAIAIIAFREFAVSGLRLVASQKNIVISAAKLGKLKTAATMVCLAAMIIISHSRLFDIICTYSILLTTIGSGMEYFISNKNVFS